MDEREPIEDEIPPKPGAEMKKLGGRMVGICFLCLVTGRAIVNLFFSEMKGQGLTPLVLVILIPIWLTGIIGLLLLLVGSIRNSRAR